MKNPAFIIGAVVILGLGIFGAYEYSQNRQLRAELAMQMEAQLARIDDVQGQVAALSDALTESAAISAKTKEELQRLNEQNRKEIEALRLKASAKTLSQEDLLTSAVAKASPAVVSVIVSKDIPQVEVQYVNPFEGRDIGIRIPVYRQVGTKKETIGGGSGFIVRPDGYIITNKHVVSDTAAEYTVLLSTGAQKPAKVHFRDPTGDLAILKIDGTGYMTIGLANSSELKLGQTVAAIGNALGEYSNSVSVGIISGLNRNIQAKDSSGAIITLPNVIQTDAAINRGNSGGPLIDLNGAAVGVNVAVQSGAQSIGFAIPINNVQALLNRVF